MRLCYSCAIYVKAFLSENEECFLDGHISAFEFFGGVPKRLIFDNAKVAVKEGLGAYVSKETRRYMELQAHYVFTTDYCNPRKGNEKGLVENLVGLARRNFLVPMPQVSSIKELNLMLRSSCEAYMNHHIQGHKDSVGNNYAHEQPYLTKLPLYPYSPEKCFYSTVSSYSLIAHGTNRYSVPVAPVGKEVMVKMAATNVTIHYKGEPVAEHNRCYDKHQKIYDIKHYMPLLKMKRRALFNAAPVKQYVPKEVLDEFAGKPDGRTLLLDYLENSIGVHKIPSVQVIPSNLHNYDQLIQEVQV